jgi:alpha-beta hydrolase superfamily lysophospholipase
MSARDPTYWKQHYVVASDADEIERHIERTTFCSSGRPFELIYFETGEAAPTILISQGSGGHAYVFAELGYHLHLRGFNVCIMPKQGGVTISELLPRHQDALRHIRTLFNDQIGVFAEGLGGFAAFYLALTDSPMRSVALQNAPAILTEAAFHAAILQGSGSARRRRYILPVGKALVRLAPGLPLPISSYLDWKELIDTKEDNRAVETRLVVDGYLHDPGFDTWYPLAAAMSLLLTPPPRPLEALQIPTMFMVARRGFGGAPYSAYLEDLYRRLPPAKKRWVDINGSVYWMLSHPHDAAEVIGTWFAETLTREPMPQRDLMV